MLGTAGTVMRHASCTQCGGAVKSWLFAGEDFFRARVTPAPLLRSSRAGVSTDIADCGACWALPDPYVFIFQCGIILNRNGGYFSPSEEERERIEARIAQEVDGAL